MSKTSTYDSGRVIIGGGIRLPAAKPVATSDAGTVILGGGIRLPAVRG